MTWDSPGDDLEVEILDEPEDDWQRRQFLQQIYESVQETREAFAEHAVKQNERSYTLASAYFYDLLRLVRPLLVGTPVWGDVKIGEIEVVEEPDQEVTTWDEQPASNGSVLHIPRTRRVKAKTVEKEIVGLRDVFALEDGYETLVEREATGDSTATVQDERRKPLPPQILKRALDALVEFLHRQDILVAETGEGEARDGDPI